MDEFSYELKIPKDRIAVLIGKNGEKKQELEEATGSKMNIDSKEGDITLTGDDSLKIYTLMQIVKAVGRGFNPEIAELLLKQDHMLEIISLSDYAKTKDHALRIKGRIIGKEGKSRRNIEVLTETHICVYGKTIGIIGRHENLAIARRAVDSLLIGSPHSTVYKWLERKRRELKQMEYGINDAVNPE